MKVKKLVVLAVSVVTLMGFATSLNAASWSVNYTAGVPAQYTKQYDTVYVPYYAEGFKGTCSSITGTQGRTVNLTATNAGGIIATGGSTIPITAPGNINSFKTRSSTTGNVTFRFAAVGGYSCTANGTISINN